LCKAHATQTGKGEIMRRTATFHDGSKMLTGREARKAWKEQRARCNCGSCGDAEHAISGTVGPDMPAQWLGCDNCSGQALGSPLVYRLPSQMDV